MHFKRCLWIPFSFTFRFKIVTVGRVGLFGVRVRLVVAGGGLSVILFRFVTILMLGLICGASGAGKRRRRRRKTPEERKRNGKSRGMNRRRKSRRESCMERAIVNNFIKRHKK